MGPLSTFLLPQILARVWPISPFEQLKIGLLYAIPTHNSHENYDSFSFNNWSHLFTKIRALSSLVFLYLPQPSSEICRASHLFFFKRSTLIVSFNFFIFLPSLPFMTIDEVFFPSMLPLAPVIVYLSILCHDFFRPPPRFFNHVDGNVLSLLHRLSSHLLS